MGVLATDSIDDPKQPKQSDRQDSPSFLKPDSVEDTIIKQNMLHADSVMSRVLLERANLKITFPLMVEGQDAWRVGNAMAFITPEQKPTPDTRTRYQRLMHRVLKRLWEWSEVFELYLYGKMRRFAPKRERQDSMAGPFSVRLTRLRPMTGTHLFADLVSKNDSRFHCTECGQGFGVNDYESNTVTCPKCGNTGIDTITDSLEGGG